MKNQDLHLVRGIDVRAECVACKGEGRVPGGERKYGELIACPICVGRGVTPETITLEQAITILQRASYLTLRSTSSETRSFERSG